jgi:hypothetical protein
MGGAERVGETVRRPCGAWTPAVHALLGHLEAVGFDGAPRVLGIDELGREVLTYMPSEATSRVDAPKSLRALAGVGRLLRRYHDAVASFAPPPDARWRLGGAPCSGTIICHNDVNPGNVVYRDGRPYAFIDWDLAGPAPPVDDLARAAILFVPLLDDEIARTWGYRRPADRARRLVALCGAYGFRDPFALVDEVERLERRDLELIETLGARGVSPYDAFAASGSADASRRELAWLARHRSRLERELSRLL